mgnify:FL=1
MSAWFYQFGRIEIFAQWNRPEMAMFAFLQHLRNAWQIWLWRLEITLSRAVAKGEGNACDSPEVEIIR